MDGLDPAPTPILYPLESRFGGIAGFFMMFFIINDVHTC